MSAFNDILGGSAGNMPKRLGRGTAKPKPKGQSVKPVGQGNVSQGTAIQSNVGGQGADSGQVSPTQTVQNGAVNGSNGQVPQSGNTVAAVGNTQVTNGSTNSQGTEEKLPEGAVLAKDAIVKTEEGGNNLVGLNDTTNPDFIKKTKELGRDIKQGKDKPYDYMTYENMYKLLNPYRPPTAEELAQERKREKREKLFAAIGDGISALSNLYFTHHYAPNRYDANATQSDKVEARWTKERVDREARINAYIRNLMAAKQADQQRVWKDREWKLKLENDAYNKKINSRNFHYQVQKDVADQNFKEAEAERNQKNIEAKAKQDQKNFDTTNGLKVEQFEHKKNVDNANIGLRTAELGEKIRSNRTKEKQEQQRINISKQNASSGGGGKYYGTLIGTPYKTESDYKKAVISFANKYNIPLTQGTGKNISYRSFADIAAEVERTHNNGGIRPNAFAGFSIFK